MAIKGTARGFCGLPTTASVRPTPTRFLAAYDTPSLKSQSMSCRLTSQTVSQMESIRYGTFESEAEGFRDAVTCTKKKGEHGARQSSRDCHHQKRGRLTPKKQSIRLFWPQVARPPPRAETSVLLARRTHLRGTKRAGGRQLPRLPRQRDVADRSNHKS